MSISYINTYVKRGSSEVVYPLVERIRKAQAAFLEALLQGQSWEHRRIRVFGCAPWCDHGMSASCCRKTRARPRFCPLFLPQHCLFLQVS